MLVAIAKEQGHCVFLTGQDDAEAAAEAALGVNWIPLVEKERMQGRAGQEEDSPESDREWLST